MSDHAAVVREALRGCVVRGGADPRKEDALAALDALVAEIRSLNEQVVGAVDLLEGEVAERDRLRTALKYYARWQNEGHLARAALGEEA